jgi:hypothetical protein
VDETSFDPNGALSAELLAGALREWRNHWSEVLRIYEDFPDDIQRQVILRPTDIDEALRQTRAQFAVLFHPDAMATFVRYLDHLLEAVERFAEQNALPLPGEESA